VRGLRVGRRARAARNPGRGGASAGAFHRLRAAAAAGLGEQRVRLRVVRQGHRTAVSWARRWLGPAGLGRAASRTWAGKGSVARWAAEGAGPEAGLGCRRRWRAGRPSWAGWIGQASWAGGNEGARLGR
jgi:hypothetical protein